MLRFAGCLFFLATVCCGVSAQPKLVHTFFFVGDAGEHHIIDDPLGDVLRERQRLAGPSTVIFLGDNVYPAGLPARSSKRFARASETLAAQVSWVEPGSEGVFVPGNHDWDHWGENGLFRIRNAESWFDSLENARIHQFPQNGCPGPVQIAVFEQHVLLVMDTQWFLHGWEKPGENECQPGTPDAVLAELDSFMSAHREKRIWVAGHHPILTYGDHGGYFTVKDHLFPLTDLHPALFVPLPVIGSLYPLYRKWFGHPQDTRNPRYKKFADPLSQVLEKYPGSVYVAGHEHALQYIVRDPTHFVVSGSAAKTTSVKRRGHARLAEGVIGFVEAGVYGDGSAELHFIRVDREYPQGSVIGTFPIR